MDKHKNMFYFNGVDDNTIKIKYIFIYFSSIRKIIKCKNVSFNVYKI